MAPPRKLLPGVAVLDVAGGTAGICSSGVLLESCPKEILRWLGEMAEAGGDLRELGFSCARFLGFFVKGGALVEGGPEAVLSRTSLVAGQAISDEGISSHSSRRRSGSGPRSPLTFILCD